jgi:ammonium transporter, Amt family
MTGERRDQRLDYSAFMNGILAGCVSITASCDRVSSLSAIIIGLIGSVIYCTGCVILTKL